LTSNDKLARLAGLLYVMLWPTTGLWYGTWRTLMAGDAAATLAHIQTSRTLFELAIVAGAAGFVVYLVLGIVLYRLFSSVSHSAASLLLAFVAASVPLSLAAVARQIDVVSLLDGGKGLPALSGGQLQVDLMQAQVMLALHSYDHLFLITTIFSGLWLIPLGWLMFRSGFAPRLLCVLLLLGCIFYVSSFVGTVFNRDYANTVLGRIIGISCGIPGLMGELGTALWLLIKGARQRKTAVVAVT
jgi:hypothetical protein